MPSTDGFRPVLHALRTRADQYFGDSAATLEPVLRLDRPFSSVLRLRVTTRAGSTYAFLKVYKARPRMPYEAPLDLAQMVDDEFLATARLHAALAHRPGLCAPRPISAFPEYRAIITEEVAGTTFDRLLRAEAFRWTPSPMLLAIATRIGAWIREYQRLVPAEGQFALAAQREYVDERLRYITPRILSHNDRARVLAMFDKLAADVPAEAQPLVAIHADLCPGNIIVTQGGGVSVLDFAMAQAGNRFHDVAHLFMHLDRLRARPRVCPALVPSIQLALLRVSAGPSAVPDPLFRLMLLQHVICHVTQLAQLSAGRLDGALRWLIRRRWRACLAIPALAAPDAGARLPRVLPAHPSNPPIH